MAEACWENIALDTDWYEGASDEDDVRFDGADEEARERTDAAFIDDYPDIVKMYFDDVRNIPVLTQEEERELIRRMREGDEQARDTFVQANLRLVIYAVRPFKGRGMSFLDLVQEGNIGLLMAVERYDERFGTRFSTYAMWWIRETVLRAIAYKSRTIRIPPYMTSMIAKVKRLSRAFAAENGREPTVEEIAGAMGVSVDTVRQIRNAESTNVVSLQKKIKEGEKTEFIQTVEDAYAVSPEEEYEARCTRETVDDLLGRLTPNEEMIIRRRFGFNNGEVETLDEIGKSLGVTRERVRQIEMKAKKKIRMLSVRYGIHSAIV